MNYFIFINKMPCTQSSANHKLCKTGCKQSSCCSSTSAFSSNRFCEQACVPKEAFGLIVTSSGVTGAYILPEFSNQGILNVSSILGVTGSAIITLDPNFFDGCTGSLFPVTTITPINQDDPFPLLTRIFLLPPNIIAVNLVDVANTPVFGTFSFRAIQANNC
jgi:hypothetical protein